MSRPMEITFVRLDDRGGDREELVDFLTAHEFPFHATRRPARATVESWIDGGRFGDPEHAAYWIHAHPGRIGLVVRHDLTDDAPLFDLRLATEHRGKGYRADVLKALTAQVFTTMPAVNRFEGQTREDNIAMRKTFVGRVREGGAVPSGRPVHGRPLPGAAAGDLPQGGHEEQALGRAERGLTVLLDVARAFFDEAGWAYETNDGAPMLRAFHEGDTGSFPVYVKAQDDRDQLVVYGVPARPRSRRPPDRGREPPRRAQLRPADRQLRARPR
jgi:Acetyltransferase (GNAT) domain